MFDLAYTGQFFEVVREVHLPPGQVFKNRMGRIGRHGWIIRNIATGEMEIVGEKLIRLIHDRYSAIELPFEQRNRLTPAEYEKLKAERKIKDRSAAAIAARRAARAARESTQ